MFAKPSASVLFEMSQTVPGGVQGVNSNQVPQGQEQTPAFMCAEIGVNPENEARTSPRFVTLWIDSCLPCTPFPASSRACLAFAAPRW